MKTDWDNLSGDELNRRIAELRGWVAPEEGTTNWWRDENGNPMTGYSMPPDIAGNKHDALDAAEGINETRRWRILMMMNAAANTRVCEIFTMDMRDTKEDYAPKHFKESLLDPDTDNLCIGRGIAPTLSLAIARAMGKALEAGK